MKKNIIWLFLSIFLLNGCLNTKQPTSQDEIKVLPVNERFTLDKQHIFVEDGDTIFYKDSPIRFLGVDAPEQVGPFVTKGDEPHATKARKFVEERINNAVLMEAKLLSEQDRYGRYLGHVFIDGESLSLMLIENGHAYETITRFGHGHDDFLELSRQIQEASKGKNLPFVKPWKWRALYGIKDN